MISLEARWRWVATLNPMSAPAEAFKYALLGQSSWTPSLALGAWFTTALVLVAGIIAFTRAERTIIDVA
jgi:ABC-type polysaccharide/polyol phosphate export permease